MLAKHLGVATVSTGVPFRAECAAGTELGRTMCGILHEGGLASDELVNQAVENRLHRDDCRQGFMLDGYPRSVEQEVPGQIVVCGRLSEARGTASGFARGDVDGASYSASGVSLPRPSLQRPKRRV